MCGNGTSTVKVWLACLCINGAQWNMFFCFVLFVFVFFFGMVRKDESRVGEMA